MIAKIKEFTLKNFKIIGLILICGSFLFYTVHNFGNTDSFVSALGALLLEVVVAAIAGFLFYIVFTDNKEVGRVLYNALVCYFVLRNILYVKQDLVDLATAINMGSTSLILYYSFWLLSALNLYACIILCIVLQFKTIKPKKFVDILLLLNIVIVFIVFALSIYIAINTPAWTIIFNALYFLFMACGIYVLFVKIENIYLLKLENKTEDSVEVKEEKEEQ